MVARRSGRSFSASTLTRLRQMPASDALALLSMQVKLDPTYQPRQGRTQLPLARKHGARRVRDPDHGDQVVRHAGALRRRRRHRLGDACARLVVRRCSQAHDEEVERQWYRSSARSRCRARQTRSRAWRRQQWRRRARSRFASRGRQDSHCSSRQQWRLIEPAVAFLHEHSVQRAHTADTLRTYAEILYDWFETLEQNDIPWDTADAVDLVAYRNRMMAQPSPHTGRPYRIDDHQPSRSRRAEVLRVGSPDALAAMRRRWQTSRATSRSRGNIGQSAQGTRHPIEREPLRAAAVRITAASARCRASTRTAGQARTALRPDGALAVVHGPSDQRTAAPRCQRHRRSSPFDKPAPHHRAHSQGPQARLRHRTGQPARRDGGLRIGASLQPGSQRARRKRRPADHTALFINARGAPAGKNAYQRAVSQAGLACGFKATTHLLRATFACMLLARLEHLASEGARDQPAGRGEGAAGPRTRRDHRSISARHRRRRVRSQGRARHAAVGHDGTMRSRRRSIARNLAREPGSASVHDAQSARDDAPRLIRQTVVDFSSLRLPEDVRLALAQAFWSHVGARSEPRHQVVLDIGIDLRSVRAPSRKPSCRSRT